MRLFSWLVRRSSDRRLERTFGSKLGLRVLFGAMVREYRPQEGFRGALRYELRGRPPWTVHCGEHKAVARQEATPDPVVTIKVTVADFLRIAAGELDPAKAVLMGQLELAGDFGVALRIGSIFGQPSGF